MHVDDLRRWLLRRSWRLSNSLAALRTEGHPSTQCRATILTVSHVDTVARMLPDCCQQVRQVPSLNMTRAM